MKGDIVLNSCHITEDTEMWLGGYPWVVSMNDEHIPGDLFTIVCWCQCNGKQAIFFSGNGEVIEDLPIYQRTLQGDLA